MVNALRTIGLVWLAFNLLVGTTLMILFAARAVRRKKRLRDSFVAQLMRAHRQVSR